jgi:hypothetical protein
MLKIEFEDEKDQVKISVEATGTNHELAHELATLITERNTIIMKLITERPGLAPLLLISA